MALGWTMGLKAGSSVPEGGCSFTFITWGERRASRVPPTVPRSPSLHPPLPLPAKGQSHGENLGTRTPAPASPWGQQTER